ncbi:MAG: hypothetical protein QGG09_14625, partial [Pirellulaceae bacterium]|nr:hypothetical protein [Pirellulaceae bacterium]
MWRHIANIGPVESQERIVVGLDPNQLRADGQQFATLQGFQKQLALLFFILQRLATFSAGGKRR